MKTCFKHIILWALLFGVFIRSRAQTAMPDTVCVGATRLYQVNDALRPSTYTWWIDGVVQNATGHEISITWSNPGVYLVSVQEHANGGCDGDIRTGKVFVKPPPLPAAGADLVVC